MRSLLMILPFAFTMSLFILSVFYQAEWRTYSGLGIGVVGGNFICSYCSKGPCHPTRGNAFIIPRPSNTCSLLVPRSLNVMSYTIYYFPLAYIALFCIVPLKRGIVMIANNRAAQSRRCKCGYDLAGLSDIGPLRCPECGLKHIL